MWRVLAVVLSVAVGVVVAALLGGSPSVALYVIVAAGAVGAAAMVGSGVRDQRRLHSSPPPPAITPPPDNQLLDREIVEEIRRIVSDHDVYRLTSQDFASPWRGSLVEPWTNLVAYRAQGHVLHPGLDGAFDDLVSAAASFLEAHRANTFTDSLVLSEDWRDVGWSRADEATLTKDEIKRFENRSVLLRARALAVGNAYRRFTQLLREGA